MNGNIKKLILVGVCVGLTIAFPDYPFVADLLLKALGSFGDLSLLSVMEVV